MISGFLKNQRWAFDCENEVVLGFVGTVIIRGGAESSG
jgi:hypothetical protein